MQTGLDQISLLQKKLKGKRIGLFCHAASVNAKREHILEIFIKHKMGILTVLFAPEHGLWGVAQDMETVEEKFFNGLPVYSLYGSSLDTLEPRGEWLDGLDAVVCDLQDVGSRYYTFVYSMALMLKACAKKNLPLFVLDRPNPLNGIEVEGGKITPGFESFVGLYSIPNRHGMTVGELAHYFNEVHLIRGNLEVIPLLGWNRKKYFEETKLPWVMPSPNMPTLETARVYTGMCLLEATEISEGRGTTRPFEIFGAPFVDPTRLTQQLLAFRLPGLCFRPLYFKPAFHKFVGEICGGLQLHVTDRKKFRPYKTGLAVLKALHDLYPQQFSWRRKPYEFVKDTPAIDLLTGSDQFRLSLEKGTPWKEICKNYEEGKKDFLKMRKEFLRYP